MMSLQRTSKNSKTVNLKTLSHFDNGHGVIAKHDKDNKALTLSYFVEQM